MVELRHGVSADLLDGRVQIGFREAVRLCLRHFVFLGTFVVHLVHPLHNAVQNLLLAGVVLVQSPFGNSQPVCNVAHGSAQVSLLRKQFQRNFQNALLGISCHHFTPSSVVTVRLPLL